MFDEGVLDAEILAAVRHVWHNETRPLLLSQLGLTALSDEAKEFVAEHSVSLKRHARQRLSEELRFVPMLRQGGGLAPAAETERMSDVDLERAYNAAVSAIPKRARRIRFEREVWRAFADPLPDGTLRAINATVSPSAVRQLGVGDQLLPDELPVTANETAISDAPDGGVTAVAVERAILNWCAEMKIDPSDLAVTLPTRPASGSAGTAGPTRAHGGAPDSPGFADVLRSIPREQLARVSIPGDVLLSIVERLVGR